MHSRGHLALSLHIPLLVSVIRVITAPSTSTALIHLIFVSLWGIRATRSSLLAAHMMRHYTVLVGVVCLAVIHRCWTIVATVRKLLFRLCTLRVLISWSALLMRSSSSIVGRLTWWRTVFGCLCILLSCLLLSNNSLLLQVLCFASCIIQVNLPFVFFTESSIRLR